MSLILGRQWWKLGPYLRKRSVPQRRFATQRNAAADDHFVAYTWLTKTPGVITPDDILSSLPSIPPSLAESNSIPILLLTPSFAQWADTTNLFVEQCINRLYCNTPPRDSTKPVHAIVAVVDKLPDIRAGRKDSTGNSIVAESEGLSLLFVSKESVQGKAATPRRIRSSEAEDAALVFSFQAEDNVTGRRAVHEVGLRLANTLFNNGNENTLFGTRWSYNFSSSNFTLDRSIGLSQCRVASVVNSVRNSLKFPLHPVGQRREVISGMGNILRQLAKHSNGTSKDPMPASSELEKELPRYIEEHDIADHRVSVWALVESPSDRSQSGTDGSQDRLVDSIQAGGKLHRVMSGGGGWGKKQGLLSLDYETSFLEAYNDNGVLTLDNLFSPCGTSTVQTTQPLFDITTTSSVSNLSSLSQAARPGDYVQFYVSVKPDQISSGQPEWQGLQEGAISYHFGVVFDHEMVMNHMEKSAPPKDLIVIPNCFGALSEKAITYSQPIHTKSDEGILESGTKIDIPGSRPFFGALGCTSAIVFTCFGAAYGTAKAGVGVCGMAVLRPDLIVKNIVPIVMAGIIGIYGLVVSVLIANDLQQLVPLYTGFIQLGAGLAVGLAGLAAGFAIGIVGDAGVRGTAQQPRLYVGMILILIFAEVLGLYGLIVALLMNSRAKIDAKC
ncbi:hypothetical protein BDV28DRAFT_155575 [Aspergillus coremiiformis]|uniref:V-type proton ATPase subunit C n=1 Tax=Aspergillus coremiiformis TaxID=138285 RepID=A0A5N6ZCI0_9EURO|nr:hypothetical protein BDV28DRAFT_155575 [Aspergillus coremiiformis]